MRDPLDPARLRTELLEPGALWRSVDVVAETGSTNADLAARARAGEPAGVVLITDFQSAGRGRLGRTWTAPAGTSIAMSLLVQPHDVAPARWTWLPLLAGMAVVEALRRAAEAHAVLKWPNDVLVEGRKICGILAERVETPTGPACVVGIGVNVHLDESQLPMPTAISLALLNPSRVAGRNPVITTILRAFAALYTEWETAGDDTAFAVAYVARCDTIGRRVRVSLAGGPAVEGDAEAIDRDGRLVVRTRSGLQTFGAGDVVHLR
ncbi:MAG TPA: biotin--[acetyl-CoA-carboxylase] ligase [Propionibacteriaceae bacterium]|nr:biotin--[acetyl-CoA-carboxylase] ligase [Propionibacteriaceae bacterium]